ncbi:hypothetical protein ACTQ54_12270 [Fundicoccus sp. Sow4_H7]|uniref:hypothetical protein n=1 Tax=Fundicoccus sp. Sow4_H7 TaxID=3438784 RepID=UPI003F90F502
MVRQLYLRDKKIRAPKPAGRSLASSKSTTKRVQPTKAQRVLYGKLGSHLIASRQNKRIKLTQTNEKAVNFLPVLKVKLPKEDNMQIYDESFLEMIKLFASSGSQKTVLNNLDRLNKAIKTYYLEVSLKVPSENRHVSVNAQDLRDANEYFFALEFLGALKKHSDITHTDNDIIEVVSNFIKSYTEDSNAYLSYGGIANALLAIVADFIVTDDQTISTYYELYQDIQSRTFEVKRYFTSLYSLLKATADQREMLAQNTDSNAWRTAYMLKTIRFNEYKRINGDPLDEKNYLLIDLDADNLDGMQQSLEIIADGTALNYAFTDLIKVLAKHFKLKHLLHAISVYLPDDANATKNVAQEARAFKKMFEDRGILAKSSLKITSDSKYNYYLKLFQPIFDLIELDQLTSAPQKTIDDMAFKLANEVVYGYISQKEYNDIYLSIETELMQRNLRQMKEG